jgi:peptide/nickel transport system permease protein
MRSKLLNRESRLYHIGARARFALRYFVRLLRAHPVYAVGYVIVAVMTIFALAAPLIAPYSPLIADPSGYLLPPSFSHLLGTDVPGRDVLSRAIFAPRADLVIALVGTGISASTGASVKRRARTAFPAAMVSTSLTVQFAG